MKQPESPDNAALHKRMAKHVDETYQTRGVPEAEPELTAGTLAPEHGGAAVRTISGAGITVPRPDALSSEQSALAQINPSPQDGPEPETPWERPA